MRRPFLEDKKNNLQLICFEKADEFKKWHSGWDGVRKHISLVDYYLDSQEENGLQVVEGTGIADRSVLVTSIPEDETIQNHASRIGVRVIGKDTFFSLAVSVM